MCAVSRDRRGRYAAGAAVAIACIALGVCVVLALTWFIDHKLNESAENQVIAFTEQAASNISDRMFMVQNAVGAFTVQSSNPADLVSALSALRERHGFSHAAAVGMDGTGFLDDGSPFSTGDLVQQETALSQQVASYSDTFVNDEGVRVRLAQEPLYLDGVLVGALYVQIPLDLFTMPADLDMFDGRGYFMLFEAKTGEILVEPGEETKTPISGSMTLYDFLDEAARYEIPTAFDSSDEASAALLAVQAQQGCDMDGLKGSVARGNTGLTTAVVDGKASYVCVAPVGSGRWYACGVVPMQNVRAEASVVTTTLLVMVFIMFACLLVAGLLVISTYRKRIRARHVAMMSHLYEALSESVDMAVNLYSPSDRRVTPIVAKAADIIGYTLEEREARGCHRPLEGRRRPVRSHPVGQDRALRAGGVLVHLPPYRAEALGVVFGQTAHVRRQVAAAHCAAGQDGREGHPTFHEGRHGCRRGGERGEVGVPFADEP